jgi:TfoX/Sxy family transcriptional regulator of competence genes
MATFVGIALEFHIRCSHTLFGLIARWTKSLEAKMATRKDFVTYVSEQASLGPALNFKSMFGEYGIYLDGKMIGLVCDNSVFVKPTEATTALTSALPMRMPYPGAKPHPVADELLDDPTAFKALLEQTARALPTPKPKKPKSPTKKKIV